LEIKFTSLNFRVLRLRMVNLTNRDFIH